MAELEDVIIQQLVQLPTLTILYAFWRMEIKPLAVGLDQRLDQIESAMRGLQSQTARLVDCDGCTFRQMAENAITDKLGVN